MQGAILDPDSHAALGAAIGAHAGPRVGTDPCPPRQPGPGRRPDRPQPGVTLLCRRLHWSPSQGQLQLVVLTASCLRPSTCVVMLVTGIYSRLPLDILPAW